MPRKRNITTDDALRMMKKIGTGGGGGIAHETDPTVPSWAKQPTKPTYTAAEVGARPATWTPSASDVGADPSGTANSVVSGHNTNTAAHNDIRLLIEGLTTRLNALANSDDTTLDQMAEIVAYIKANRTLIESVTTDKVSVADIIDDLETNVSNKPLSAAQGASLYGLIQEIWRADYASTAWVNRTLALELANYVTESELNAKGYPTYDGTRGDPPTNALLLTGGDKQYLVPYMDEYYTIKPYNLPLATEDTLGAMSAADKKKLGAYSDNPETYAKQTDVTQLSEEILDLKESGTGGGAFYGVCDTAADTVAKTVTVEGNFTLKEGAMVAVKFTYANSIASPTLNVNGTGDIPIYRYGTTAASTSTTVSGWVAGAVQVFVYDGAGWIRDYWSNTTYTNVALGQGYATCSTAADTVAKTASLSSYTLTANGVVSVRFTYDVPANATLNINSKGAKAIYFNNAKITDGIIKAGDTATFIYNSYYRLISIDRWQNDIESLSKDVFDLKLAVGDGGDEGQKWIGQTPYKMTEDASLLSLIGDGEYSFTITSDTVADLENIDAPKCTNCELVKVGKYYEIRSTGGSAWYSSYADFVVSGLTIGEKYVFYVDGLGRNFNLTNDKRYCGYYIVCAGTSYSSSNVIGNTGSNFDAYQSNIETLKVSFTATTESVVIRAYPSGDAYFASGASVAEINSFYINRAGSNKHTGIIDLAGTFTDMRTLSDVPAGATITTDPVCDVYAAIAKEDEENAVYMPLKDKTVVCFGDSLFGMYRGADSAPAFIAESTGATVHNVGFGGCRMSVHPTSGYAAFSMWALAKAIVENNWTTQDAQASSGSAYFPDQLALLKSIDFSTVDYVVIHYGTNDFGAGTAVSIDNANDHDDYNTLCGALRYSIEKLHGAYPKLKIFVSLPVFRFWTSNNVTTYSDTYLNHGMKLTEFVEALRSTASEYNLPVIDGYYGLGINKANASTFLSDGTHHNADGRERFGEFIGANLIAQQTTAKSGVDASAITTLIENAIGSAIGGAY